jgi:hypothetical protein
VRVFVAAREAPFTVEWCALTGAIEHPVAETLWAFGAGLLDREARVGEAELVHPPELAVRADTRRLMR